MGAIARRFYHLNPASSILLGILYILGEFGSCSILAKTLGYNSALAKQLFWLFKKPLIFKDQEE
jgi:hypothetical protein